MREREPGTPLWQPNIKGCVTLGRGPPEYKDTQPQSSCDSDLYSLPRRQPPSAPPQVPASPSPRLCPIEGQPRPPLPHCVALDNSLNLSGPPFSPLIDLMHVVSPTRHTCGPNMATSHSRSGN